MTQSRASSNIILALGIALVSFLVVGYSIFAAWQEPIQAPPGGNVSPPLNISAIGQTKSGPLGIGANGYDPAYGLTVGDATNNLGLKSRGDVCTELGGTGWVCLGSVAGGGAGLWSDAGTYIYPNNYNQLAITDTGRLGIGTTSPLQTLHVNSPDSWSARFTTPSGYIRFGPANTGGAHIYTDRPRFFFNKDIVLVGNPSVLSAYSTNNLQLATNSGSSVRITILASTGNVGIGTTAPTSKLHIDVGAIEPGVTIQSGQTAPVLQWLDTADGDYFRWRFYRAGNRFELDSSGAGDIIVANTNGNVGIGTTSPSDKLTIAGGNLNLSGNDIENVDKITVNTVDPVYELRGKKYATYMASLLGVREEYTGKAGTTRRGDKFVYVIDFDKEAEGSDLWVWRQIVDFSKDNVEVIATPYGGFAELYYHIEGDKIIFTADKEVEFSFRLTGKRYDHQEWPTELAE